MESEVKTNEEMNKTPKRGRFTVMSLIILKRI